MLKGSFEANLREGFGELGCGPVQLLSTFRPHTMRFGSTAKVLLKCKLKYYRISECVPPKTYRSPKTGRMPDSCQARHYEIWEYC